ncbi:MAG: glycosyltransferase family 39 protein [Candidatus Brocadiia bacterium]
MVLLAIVGGGAFLRVYRIGAKSLWLDETASMELASRPLFSLVAETMERDTHPPFYYVCLHAWLWGAMDAARARAFSAVVGTATLLVLYALARHLLPRVSSLVATALLAGSAYQVYFAQEARHYVLATFLIVLSWYFLVKLVAGRRLERWPLWLGLALSNTAAMYTYYYAAFAIAGQLVVLLLLWRGVGRKLLVPWCVWQLVPAVLFAFYLPTVRQRLELLQQTVGPGAYAMDASDLLATAAQFACGFLAELSTAHTTALRLAAAGLGLAALGVGLGGVRRMPVAAAVALVWLCVPVLAVLVFPFKGHIYEPKHIIFAAPALALLVGIGLTALRGKLRAVPAMVAVLLLGANAASLGGREALRAMGLQAPWLVGYYDPRVEKENWRDAISQLVELAEPGDIVLLNPRYVGLPYRYYTDPRVTGRERPPLVLREVAETGAPLPDDHLDPERSVWLLELQSNVATPNPDVDAVLEGYEKTFHQEYADLVGRISLRRYQPVAPARGRGG